MCKRRKREFQILNGAIVSCLPASLRFALPPCVDARPEPPPGSRGDLGGRHHRHVRRRAGEEGAQEGAQEGKKERKKERGRKSDALNKVD